MLVWRSLIWAKCQWYTRCPNWLQTALFSFRGHLMMCLPTRPTQKEQGFNKLVFCLRSSRSLWGSSSPLSLWDHLQLVNLPIRDTYTLKCCLFSFSPWFQTSRNQIASVWNAFTGKGENGTRGHILLWENKQTLPTEKKKKTRMHPWKWCWRSRTVQVLISWTVMTTSGNDPDCKYLVTRFGREMAL